MDWQEDKRRVKIVNMENQGEDFEIHCQGKKFEIKDQEIMTLPALVIENAKHAVIHTKASNLEKNGVLVRDKKIARYVVVEIDEKSSEVQNSKTAKAAKKITGALYESAEDKRKASHGVDKKV